MGQPKQLLPYHGRTLLRHAAETAVATGCAPTCAGYRARCTKNWLAEIAGLPVQAVHNADWETGMASSIHAGLAALADTGPAPCSSCSATSRW